MRKIHITAFDKPLKSSPYNNQKLYRVYYGNKTKYFKTEKTTLKFLADTNIFLNGVFLQVNQCNADLYSIYRRVYFYFDRRSETEQKIIFQFEVSEKICFRLFQDTMYFDKFSDLISIANNYLSICAALDKFLTRIREDSTRYQVRIIKAHLDQVLLKLNKYPTL